MKPFPFFYGCLIVILTLSACGQQNADTIANERAAAQREADSLRKENEMLRRQVQTSPPAMQTPPQSVPIAHVPASGEAATSSLPYGIFKIKAGNKCGIESGEIRTEAVSGNKFSFKIDVSNRDMFMGRLDGTATVTGAKKAVFSNADCGNLTLDYISPTTIRVTEKDCIHGHGTGICFEGDYVKQ